MGAGDQVQAEPGTAPRERMRPWNKATAEPPACWCRNSAVPVLEPEDAPNESTPDERSTNASMRFRIHDLPDSEWLVQSSVDTDSGGGVAACSGSAFAATCAARISMGWL